MELLSDDSLYQGKWKEMRTRRVQLANEDIVEYEYCDAPTSINVLLIQDGNLKLVVQPRPVIARDYCVEIISGGANSDESPEEAAVRECREETGWHPKSLRLLRTYYECPWILPSRAFLFLATNSVWDPLPADEGEHIEVIDVPLDEVYDIIPTLSESRSIMAVYDLLQLIQNGETFV